MNKQELEARIQAIRQALQQKQAECNVITGGLYECEYWLQQLNKEAPTEQPESNLQLVTK